MGEKAVEIVAGAMVLGVTATLAKDTLVHYKDHFSFSSSSSSSSSSPRCSVEMASDTTVLELLKKMAEEEGVSITDKAIAQKLDSIDPLKLFRSRFHIPKKKIERKGEEGEGEREKEEEGEEVDCWYFCGNSLGLQPIITKEVLLEELDVWKKFGVEGHFPSSSAPRPWVITDEFVQEQSAKIVGAKKEEVAIMNSLTVNLHLLMLSFYKPTSSRFKILMEGHAFPSDRYAVASQVKLRGFDPSTAIIELSPRPGEYILRTEDILKAIDDNKDSLALVMFSGIQYYTGQLFDMKTISAKAHEHGIYAGFDCAHAAGNVDLQLHDWDVDFACWCTYKYLNSGPGCIGGAFLHQRHAHRKDLDRLAGWWGHNLDTRFDMDQPFDPIPGPFGYRLSNPPVVCTASLLGSLRVFEEAGGIAPLRNKSFLLTGYLEILLLEVLGSDVVRIITPSNPKFRGCQLSLLFLSDEHLKRVEEAMGKAPPICDTRKPNVMRVAPVPLYNTFSDVFNYVHWLKSLL